MIFDNLAAFSGAAQAILTHRQLDGPKVAREG